MNKLAKRLEKIARMISASDKIVFSDSLDNAKEDLSELNGTIKNHRKDLDGIFGAFMISGHPFGDDSEFRQLVSAIDVVPSRENVDTILNDVRALRNLFDKMANEVWSDKIMARFENHVGKWWDLLDDLVRLTEEAETSLETYKEARFYKVWLSEIGNNIDVEATNEQDALDGAVAKAEKEGWTGILHDPSVVEEEAEKEGIFNSETGETSPEFDERYLYVDATMAGATQPWYLDADEIYIEPVE